MSFQAKQPGPIISKKILVNKMKQTALAFKNISPFVNLYAPIADAIKKLPPITALKKFI
jgi:uncharacterized protein (DUF1919 family)